MDKRLTAPDGAEIWGTRELTPGVAQLGELRRNAEGAVEFEHAGGTEMAWDNQRTVTRPGPFGLDELVFVDVHGREWLEHQLVEALPDPADRQDGKGA